MKINNKNVEEKNRIGKKIKIKTGNSIKKKSNSLSKHNKNQSKTKKYDAE